MAIVFAIVRTSKKLIDLSKRKEMVCPLLGRAKQSFVSKSLVLQCQVDLEERVSLLEQNGTASNYHVILGSRSIKFLG